MVLGVVEIQNVFVEQLNTFKCWDCVSHFFMHTCISYQKEEKIEWT